MTKNKLIQILRIIMYFCAIVMIGVMFTIHWIVGIIVLGLACWGAVMLLEEKKKDSRW